MPERYRLELFPTGDPYGSGFTATEYNSREEYKTGIGIYRGDIGARSRSFWRNYARRYNYILTEAGKGLWN